MEGVGARFGRSSSRYGGPATVFTGPVRKWAKKWVHVAPSSSNSNHNHHHGATVNGSSRLLLYKWTPMASNANNSNDEDGDTGNGNKPASEERPRKKFRHIPIVVLEDQNQASPDRADDEAIPDDNEDNTAETPPENDGNKDEKPDINFIPVDENQGSERQDLNEATLDLSLGLKARDGDAD